MYPPRANLSPGFRTVSVPLDPELASAGYRACRPTAFRWGPAYVAVEHVPSGTRGMSFGRTIEEATAKALKLCRARRRMKARGLVPPNAGAEPSPVRTVDLTTPEGEEKMTRMFGGEIEGR